MHTESDAEVNELLARLRAGDRTASVRLVHLYEPYLRRLVRRHLDPSLRTKLDSLDVVQSVWAQLGGDFAPRLAHIRDADHLRAYLARAARHRLIDRYRRHRAALEHEEPLQERRDGPEPAAQAARPSQEAQAAEAWEQVQALCSPTQIEIVQLRRQGLTVDEIAARTHLHPSSVRRSLYELARQLAAQQRDRF